jgi:hypothetical protein
MRACAPAARCCAPGRRRIPRPPRAAAQAASAAAADADVAALTRQVGALVGWCVQRGAQGDGLAVSPGGPGGRGRGVVATRAIEPGETLLTIPLSLGIVDEPGGHPAACDAAVLARTPWVARLACRLLQESAAGAASEWAPYMALLPRAVATPLRDDAALAALAPYAPLAAEAAEVRAHAAAAYAALQEDAPAALAGATLPQFLDAVSVVYSRAYGFRAAAGAAVTGYLRVMVPLADMINHGGDESPAAGALFPPGRDASNVRWEIAPVDENADAAADAAVGGGGFAMSVVASAPLAEGDEALFSYNEQSNDHFLCYYGFVPTRNAHDDIVLWASADEALAWHAQTFPAAWPAAAAGADRAAAARRAFAAAEARLAASADAALLAAEPRLKLLAGARLDTRLVALLASLHGAGGDAQEVTDAAVDAVHADVCTRCGELLAALGDDDARAGTGGPVADALAHKRLVLREALAALRPAAARA